jgi:hypothetical protein
MSLGELWHRRGENAEADRLLSSVYNRFTEGFETADVQAARALIHQIHDRKIDDDEPAHGQDDDRWIVCNNTSSASDKWPGSAFSARWAKGIAEQSVNAPSSQGDAYKTPLRQAKRRSKWESSYSVGRGAASQWYTSELLPL